MTPEQKGSLPLRVEKLFYELQDRIFTDIIRRIQKTGEITSTADYQINKLLILGNSTEFIEQEIKKLTGKTDPEIWELYDKVSNWEYVRYEDAYQQINGTFIPLEENEDVQQWAQAVIAQTNDEIENITRSLGMTVDMGNGKRAFTPLAQYYQKYLDRACLDIVTGSFDYNTVLRRVVKELTASGLKTIDYASGYSCRATVAARRSILTGVSQLSARINEKIAKDLGTDTYEVTWHAGHRPSHWWGGRVYNRNELVSVCGLGKVDGLCGANCRHSYLAFVPGYSVRTYTDDQLRELEANEQQTKVYNGKAYTPYQASQAQRQMETKMRAQREKVQLLKEGGADPDDVMLAKAKYQGMLDQYSVFSKKMGIPQQRERIYYDLRGRVATNTKRQNARYTSEMIRNADQDSKQYKRYKNIIRDSAGSLADFRQMKYNKPKEFELLTDYANSVKSGMISPLSGFKNYKKIHNNLEKNVVGIDTAEGTKIKGKSKHFMERVIGTMCDPRTGKPRSGVSVGDILESLINPVKVDAIRTGKNGQRSQKYVGKNATVTINPDTGILIQCNPTDSDLIRRLRNDTL